MAERILINNKWRVHPNITGVQRYAAQLVDSLEDNGLEFTSTMPERSSRLNHTLWEQSALTHESASYDTLFCPANMAPLVLPNHVRLVLTLHCLRFYFHPRNYSLGFAAWYRFAVPFLIERASTICTVSHTTAEEIQSVYPASIGKVKVVYPGVSYHFTEQNKNIASNLPSGRYFVFVGNPSAAKNMGVLIESLQYTQESFRLVLLGVSKDQLSCFMDRNPSLRKSENRILPLGHINDARQVASIMRSSVGVLTPSRYESFDLPLVEAMASMVPVLASDTPVHHEIGGNVPVYLPLNDPRAWANAMDKILDNPMYSRDLGKRGYEHSKKYNWNSAAKSVITILNQSPSES